MTMNTITLTLEATLENIEKIKSLFEAPADNTSTVNVEQNGTNNVACENNGQMVIDLSSAKPVSEPAEEAKPVTKEEVRAKAVELTKAGKQAELKDILQSFGAAKLSALKEEDYSECLRKICEVL